MQGVLHDLRYSARQLIKNPGFTLTAVVSLALGIGATTAVFSVIYAALLNPYPYPNADRIVRMTIQSEAGSGTGSIRTVPNYDSCSNCPSSTACWQWTTAR
jgi:hypothetical protein